MMHGAYNVKSKPHMKGYLHNGKGIVFPVETTKTYEVVGAAPLNR